MFIDPIGEARAAFDQRMRDARALRLSRQARRVGDETASQKTLAARRWVPRSGARLVRFLAR